MLLGSLLFAAFAGCAPLPGVERLNDNPDRRYIIVGEVHGTSETPEMFGDLVCHIAKGSRPVIVAVEAPETEQPVIDDFMRSDGGLTSRKTFLKSIFWKNPFKDGRSSVAYWALFERLRIMKAETIIEGVVACQPKPTNATENDYNAAMAALWKAALSRDKKGVLVALVGNFHARKQLIRVGSENIVPAAADLPSNETTSLNVVVGGHTWNCSNTSCSVHKVSGDAGSAREIIFQNTADAPYDGEITLGVQSTASAPVAAVHP